MRCCKQRHHRSTPATPPASLPAALSCALGAAAGSAERAASLPATLNARRRRAAARVPYRRAIFELDSHRVENRVGPGID